MSTVPQTRSRFRLPRPPLAAIIAAVLAVAALVSFVVPRIASRTADPLAGGTAAKVTRGPLVAGIGATGQVEPRRQAELSFNGATGRVAEVLVAEGDAVAAGQPLVKLETGRLDAQLAQAQAALAEAQADFRNLTDGATPEQIAAAEAQVAAARGALQQTQGSVTDADIRAARASVDEAHARLAALQGSPNNDTLTSARSAVAEAQAALDQQRSALAAAKLDAERRVNDSANALRDAQAAFATARDNLASVQGDGDDPLTGAPLTDAGKRSFVDAFEQSKRTLANAEAALNQARVELDAARQNEITGLREAEARLATAQAQLDALLNPNADTLAAARAQLANAEASLARLLGDQRAGALAAQQAQVANAEANLAELVGDPTSSELARAQARVASAEAGVTLAQLARDEAVLAAPFDGVIATVNVAEGEEVSQGSPVTILDISRYNVTVSVDEVDVARVQVGQPVDVLIDALGAPALEGRVLRISPQSRAGSEVTAYDIEVEVDPAGRPVRAGMTATATIVVERRDDVLSVPAAAVRQENGADVVSAVGETDGRTTVTARPVQTGARIDDRVEITGGLNEGERVLVPGAGE
jgi:HlyD family secretion protein